MAHEPDERVRGGRHARKARGAAPPRLPADVATRSPLQPSWIPKSRRATRPASHAQTSPAARGWKLQLNRAFTTTASNASFTPSASSAPSVVTVLPEAAASAAGLLWPLPVPSSRSGDAPCPWSSTCPSCAPKPWCPASAWPLHLLLLRQSVPPQC